MGEKIYFARERNNPKNVGYPSPIEFISCKNNCTVDIVHVYSLGKNKKKTLDRNKKGSRLKVNYRLYEHKIKFPLSNNGP